MLKDLDRVIRQVLIDGLEIKNDEIGVAFDQPRREWSAKISKPTVNMFLYDMRENPHLRQHQWEQITNGASSIGNSPGGKSPGKVTTVTQKRTPLRYDCYYMMTTWVRDHPEDEHRLLTRCMLTLARYPIIPEERLADSLLANPAYEIRTRLANHDVLTNPAEVWGALDNEMKPSISYVVTLTLDPWTMVTGPAVETLTLRTGPASGLPANPALDPEVTPVEMHWIGGVVRAKRGKRGVLPNINVAIRGTGLVTVSDEQGRYRLGGIGSGKHTLVAWPAGRSTGGKPVTRSIVVPAGSGDDYDIEV